MSLVQTAFELLFLGTIIGGLYALIAIGLSLTFGVQQVINIAHGEFVMLGAFSTFFMWEGLDINPLLAALLTMPILFVLGAALQITLLERITGRSQVTTFILTFGIALAIRNFARYFFTSDIRSISYLTSPVDILGVSVSEARLVAFGSALLVMAALALFLKYSTLGKAVRATSQNPDIARACGIDTRRIRILTFGIGAATAGYAGSMIGMIASIFPDMGFRYLLTAFVVTVLGGLGSMLGAVVGGVIVGNLETIATYYTSPLFGTATLFFTLVVVLQIRPWGLFGNAEDVNTEQF